MSIFSPPNYASRSRHGHTPQRGFVLVVALIFMIISTLIGLSLINRTVFQERLSGSEREHHRALQAAEMALRDAERDLEGIKFDGTPCPDCRANAGGSRDVNAFHNTLAMFTDTCYEGQCTATSTPTTVDDDYGDSTWDRASSCIPYGKYTQAVWPPEATDADTTTPPPCYVIELMTLRDGAVRDGGSFSGSPYFRITAWSWGYGYGTSDRRTPVVLQTIYRRIL